MERPFTRSRRSKPNITSVEPVKTRNTVEHPKPKREIFARLSARAKRPAEESDAEDAGSKQGHQVGDKLPVYLDNSKRLNASSPTKKKLPRDVDVFDISTYGEDEFGPQPEKKKKKRRKVAKKQRGDIILAFGKEARENVAPILKELKNLKTPAPAKKKKEEVSDRFPLRTVSQAPLMFQDPSVEFSPNFDNDFPPSPRQVPSQLELPDQKAPNLLSPKFAALPRYKTPMVPKHVSKREGKVSTPRLDEKYQQMDLSTKEQVKICFGFDDSEGDESVDNESLLGISPVRGRGAQINNPFSSPSASLSRLSTASIGQMGTQTKPLEGPSRFMLYSSDARMVSRFPSILMKSASQNSQNSLFASPSGSLSGLSTASNCRREANFRPKEQGSAQARRETQVRPETPAKSGALEAISSPEMNSISENSQEVKMRPKAKARPQTHARLREEVNIGPRSPSVIMTPPKKNTKQEKKLDQWASLQSSHFSEVEDCDLSFN